MLFFSPSLYLSVHCLLYAFLYDFFFVSCFHFQLEIPLAYPFFRFGSRISVHGKREEKKAKVNRIESIFCVSGCMHQKEYTVFERLSLSCVRSIFFFVWVLLCVIRYCFVPFFFIFFLFLSVFNITNFDECIWLVGLTLQEPTIANNRNHPKLLLIVGRKSANDGKLKSGSWVRAYCIGLKTI